MSEAKPSLHIRREAVHLYEAMSWTCGPDLPPGDGPDRTYYLDL